MPSDLIVSRIVLPPTVSAPCRTRVDVEITNIGSDVAELPFDVVLEFPTTDQRLPPRSLRQWVRGLEGERLSPNQTVVVTFQVSFPCRTQAQILITADFSQLVTNNLRTNPQKTILVAPIDLVPWLESSFQVVMYTPIGNVLVGKPDPPAICPNADLSIDAIVRNRGCADAPPFDVQLVVTDSQGSTARGRSIPGLAAGTSTTLQFNFKAPSTPGPITFQFCADINNVITKQCSTSGLCATVTNVVQQGSAPSATFVINGPVVPGQMPTINWGLHNDCSDLQFVQAHIVFGTTKIYDSPPAASLFRRSFNVFDTLLPIPIPSADATSFWTFGTHTLTMTFTVTGTAQPPQPVTATFVVGPEAPGIVTFGWANPPFVPWNVSYLARGSFTNNSIFSAMTITTASASETEPTLPIAFVLLLTPLLTGTPIVAGPPPRLGPAGAMMRLQHWDWMNSVNAVTGPTSLTFTYTMSFSFRDAFGNAYPGPFTAASTITVAVSMTKMLNGTVSAAAMVTAAAWAAAAAALTIVALATPYPADLVPTIAAAFCAVVAVAALGISIWFRAKAYDPPLPDFDYKQRVVFAFPEVKPLKSEVANDPLIQSLNVILQLLQRIQHADELMSNLHRKILGAHTDEAQEMVRIHVQDYKKAYSILKRSAQHYTDAIAEFEQAFRSSQIINEDDVLQMLREIKEEGVPESAKQAWAKAELSEKSLQAIADTINKFESVPDSMFEPMRQSALAFVNLLQSEDSEYNDIMRFGLRTSQSD